MNLIQWSPQELEFIEKNQDALESFDPKNISYELSRKVNSSIGIFDSTFEKERAKTKILIAICYLRYGADKFSFKFKCLGPYWGFSLYYPEEVNHLGGGVTAWGSSIYSPHRSEVNDYSNAIKRGEEGLSEWISRRNTHHRFYLGSEKLIAHILLNCQGKEDLP